MTNNSLSHYGEGHTGYVRFSRRNPQAIFNPAFRVKYSSDYSLVHLFSPDDWHRTEELLLRNSSGWGYEEEWGIVDHEKGPGVQRFPEEHLTGVIFGSRMLQNHKDEVLKWLKAWKSTVDVYEARVSTKSFSLDIVPYSR